MDGLRLPPPYAGKVTSLRQLIGELSTEISMLDEVIADLLAEHAGARHPLAGRPPVGAGVIHLADAGTAVVAAALVANGYLGHDSAERS